MTAYVVHGLDLSYFTGKLETALRLKGLPYRLVEMDTRSFRALGDRVGVRQMPHLETPAGELLTDTHSILDWLDSAHPETPLRPVEPVAAFADVLLECWADEWLWRPALHYRWWFDGDARLMSGRLARGMLRDVPLPLAVRRLLILLRQRRTYLSGDGITRKTAPAVEALFEETLAALQPLFSTQPFLAGTHPTRADAALMGPFFRHFSSDPTPRARMEAKAPAVRDWVERTWSAGPVDGALPAGIPQGLRALASGIVSDFLPAMAANQAAVASGARTVSTRSHGATFVTPPSLYRARRLADLQQRWAALPQPARQLLGEVLGSAGALAASPPRLPDRPPRADRSWHAIGA